MQLHVFGDSNEHVYGLLKDRFDSYYASQDFPQYHLHPYPVSDVSKSRKLYNTVKLINMCIPRTISLHDASRYSLFSIGNFGKICCS